MAEKALLAIASPYRERIRRRIGALAENPQPPDSLKLAGIKDTFRIRIGDYRVLYQVKRVVLVIVVIQIGHRRDVDRR